MFSQSLLASSQEGDVSADFLELRCMRLSGGNQRAKFLSDFGLKKGLLLLTNGASGQQSGQGLPALGNCANRKRIPSRMSFTKCELAVQSPRSLALHEGIASESV